jgi:hypothetical protein
MIYLDKKITIFPWMQPHLHSVKNYRNLEIKHAKKLIEYLNIMLGSREIAANIGGSVLK